MAWSRDAARAATVELPCADALAFADVIESEVRELLSSVLQLDGDLSEAILRAFAMGRLDVPHCIHPDNRDQARSAIDPRTGIIEFSQTGNMRAAKRARRCLSGQSRSEAIMEGLTFVRRRYDRRQWHPATDR
jgi:methylaspartate mutase epsilon subunit